MNSNERFIKKLQAINDKLEKNPDLKIEIDKCVSKIEEILENQVDFYVVDTVELEEYEDILDTYDEDEIYSHNDDALNLAEFIDLIKYEEQEYKISIDPIYLKEGLNDITNVLVTTYEDKMIIVPKTNKDEKE